MSDATYHEGSLTKFYSISDLRGYLYKIRSWCEGLWRYHCIDHWPEHHYEGCEPEIIRIKDTEDDLEKYSEILYHVWLSDPHRKRTKYDVVSPVLKLQGSVPRLGLEAIEMDDYYKVERTCVTPSCVHDDNDGKSSCGCPEDEECTCFRYTSGLFIYAVEALSHAFYAGFQEGDIIRGIQRPEVEKTRPQRWKPNHLDYEDVYDTDDVYGHYRRYDIKTINDMMSIFNVLRDGEHVIFEIVRNGEEIEIEMNIPFETRIIQKIYSPKIVIKRVPKMDISQGHMSISYSDPDDPTVKNYLRMKTGVDVDSHELWLEIPDTIIGVDFYIDEHGQLVVQYTR